MMAVTTPRAGGVGESNGPGRYADVGEYKAVDSHKSTPTNIRAYPVEAAYGIGVVAHTGEAAATAGSDYHPEGENNIESAYTTKTAHSAEHRDYVVPVLTVLASGSGTTFQAVIDAVAAGELPVRVNLLVVDRPGTGAADRAATAGIPVRLVDRAEHRGTAQSSGLSQAVSRVIPEETDLVLLAGFLSIITDPLLTRFHRRMINLHPALLPEFGGAGMYGRHVHEAVLAAGQKQTGCTVHYVDAGTDTGEILLHRRIPVLPEDTPDSLSRRLQPVEHRAVIDALLTLAPEVR